MKKVNLRFSLIFFLSFLIILFFGFSASAAEITYPNIPGADKTPPQCLAIAPTEQIGCLAQYVYYALLASTGMICFGVFIFGGILYLISRGSIKTTKNANAKISAALLGTGFLFASYLVLNILNPQLLTLSAVKDLLDVPPTPELIPLDPDQAFVYAEIPLGWLIERVKARAEIVEAQAIVVNDYVAEENTPGHATIKELSNCLLKLTTKCSCSMPSICNFVGVQCKGQCLEDPCNKTVSGSECREYDIPTINTHLRTAMNEIADKIKDAGVEIKEQKDILEKVTAGLQKEKQRLELAEYLMTNTTPPPTSLHDIGNYLDQPLELLDIFEQIDPAGTGSLPDKKRGDLSNFYIDNSEQHNMNLVNIVNNIVLSGPNIAPNPNWTPPYAYLPPTNKDAVILNMPELLQTDPKWAATQITNGCNDKIGVKSPPCNSSIGCGCGPTSLAMILTYFLHTGNPNDIITPDEIIINQGQEYFCGTGSSAEKLAELAGNDGIQFEQINFGQAQAKIRDGKPIMAACHHFGRNNGLDWGHITVIKGIEQGNIYFQDTVFGELLFPLSIVQGSFDCTLFAFSKI